MSKLQNWSNILVLLIATLGFGLVVSGCDSGGTSPDSNNLGDVSGAITGQVIDNATSNPIEGAKVIVAVGSLDTDGESFSATTGAEGRFAITDLPAVTADDGSDTGEDPSATYGIRVETPEGSAYRDAYRGQVELAYGNNETGAIELGANITFPLQKNNGSLSGQLGVNGSDAPLRNTELRASQNISTGFNAEGDATGGDLTVTSTTTTDGQGSFTFENLVVGNQVELYAQFNDREQLVTRKSIPDEGSAAPVNNSVDVPPFEIVDTSLEPGTDADTTQPSITFTFNRPVVENEFTRTDVPRTGTGGQNLDSEHLIDEIILLRGLKKSASSGDRINSEELNPDNFRQIDISFNDDRTELTAVPTEPLGDGINYQFIATSQGVGGLSGFGVDDSQFSDLYGLPVSNSGRAFFEFSVGADNSQPAVPSVSFNTDNPAINDDGTFADDVFDYTDETVTAPLQIDEIDDSQAEVKGYEVYYRAQNQTGRNGTGDQFVKATAVNPSASSNEFEQTFGIIPANDVDSENFDDGALEFTASVGAFPFSAEDGAYGPIEWKVRAVSINNIRGEFTDVITTGDSTQVEVDPSADITPSDSTVTVSFSEALSTSTAETTGNYTVTKNGTDISGDVSSASLSNVKAQSRTQFNTTEVVLKLNNDFTFGDNIEVEVGSSVQDLAGNGVDPDNNTATN
ncbi:carboxypeptidase-like regulatory domain-containing protein [Salinibacter ruber]|uniref:carboxypeptidase-like regulatory domain-containing protein n=1 Tax=Salinibacter ruber TaxID=146919 RepID=UPI002072C525|nr:carboxypeptidase-like regulatory domain-containing protein [Salinibacter ruber]